MMTSMAQGPSVLHQMSSRCILPSLLLGMLMLACMISQASAGENANMQSYSFDRGPVPCPLDPQTFTYVIGSDVQIWWWIRDGRDPRVMGRSTNTEQLALWQNLSSLTWPSGKPIAQPDAIVINGDLTNWGTNVQWNEYRKMFDAGLNITVFPGLGNHDYMNNLDTCFDWGIDGTTCARRSTQVMRQTAGGVPITSRKLKTFGRLQGPLTQQLFPRINAFDWGSMAYSWDAGNYHFIMLHNFPAYSIDAGSYSVAGPVVVTPSYSFLEHELNKAVATGRQVVIFIHDVDDKWRADEDERFLELLVGKPVMAVFCGHWHWSWGLIRHLKVKGDPISSIRRKIPVFRSGSSEFQTSFAVEFSKKGIQLQLIWSEEGGATVDDEYYFLPATNVFKPQLRVASLLAAGEPKPPQTCRPGWQQEGNICWAPCPESWMLEDGRCVRHGCGSLMQKNGALCYPQCRPGYEGAGPVCWEDCQPGWNSFLFMCSRMQCKEGEEQQGGLCYTPCTPGFQGLGPVCWSRCPRDYKDDGMYCRRAVLIAKKSCCCTEDNPACCNNCPPGFLDNGCMCRRNGDFIVKNSYGRGVGRPALKLHFRKSYGRGVGTPQSGSIDRDWYTLPQ